MNNHRTESSDGSRGRMGIFAWMACAWLLPVGAACTALIDQELSGKTVAATASEGGSAGSGGAGGETLATTAAATTTTPTCPAGCALAHATAICVSGACDIVDCDPGFADCNEDPLDGCEADLLDDNEQCGKCDKACKGGKTCEDGECK